MVQRTPQSRLVVATQPVDVRTGLDGLAAVCRQVLGAPPLRGAVVVVRNRSATTLTLLLYDGHGWWLCTQRLSTGRFQWWPPPEGGRLSLSARALLVLLWNGLPDQAQMAYDWRQLT